MTLKKKIALYVGIWLAWQVFAFTVGLFVSPSPQMWGRFVLVVFGPLLGIFVSALVGEALIVELKRNVR